MVFGEINSYIDRKIHESLAGEKSVVMTACQDVFNPLSPAGTFVVHKMAITSTVLVF